MLEGMGWLSQLWAVEGACERLRPGGDGWGWVGAVVKRGKRTHPELAVAKLLAEGQPRLGHVDVSKRQPLTVRYDAVHKMAW